MNKDDLKDYFEFLFKYAVDDVKKGYINPIEFKGAIEYSGKYGKFLPKYPELREIIKTLRREQEDARLEEAYNPNQLPEGQKPDDSTVKEHFGNIKDIVKNV